MFDFFCFINFDKRVKYFDRITDLDIYYWLLVLFDNIIYFINVLRY
jgi:hypothetical protein